MDLDKIHEILSAYREELEKAQLETKHIPNMPSSAKMGDMRDGKMKDEKHMNGNNSNAYNYKGEKEVHNRVPKEVADLSKDEAKKLAQKIKAKKEQYKNINTPMPDPLKVGIKIANRDAKMGKEEGGEPDMASPEKPKGLDNKRKPVTHDECGRPFAKEDHAIKTELVKFDSNGQWSLDKSNYGPKGYGLYNPTDNIKRKAKNTGDTVPDAGKNVNTKKYTTSGSSMSAVHENSQQKRYDKEAKSKVKQYSAEEIQAMNEARGLKKSEIEVSYWDDGVLEIDFYEDNSTQVDFLVKKLEDAGYEELEKKSKNWTPKAKHKSDKGGLTAAGRKSYNKKTGGNLKAPQPGGGPRKRSFCARNKGQIDMHNINCQKTPDKRACKARRRWKC